MRQTALRAAKKAGSLLLRHFGKKIRGVRKKKGTSLVSSVDLECNRIILNEIKKKFPHHNIITEESPPIKNRSEYTWFVDPIDGTHNYIRGLPFCGVSIALAKNNEVILGIMYLPMLRKMYVAEKGKGALCNGRRIRVSKRKEIDFSFILFDSSSERRSKKFKFLAEKSRILFNERIFGCAIYAAAMVAEGKADAFINFKTKSWDIAAGFLLIEEAGGKCSTFRGERWSPADGSYVASNRALHSALLRLV